jgi:OmcA/MtrC family decaheme c-type cytochrome
LALVGTRLYNYPQFFEINTYNLVSPPAVRDFLVGSATALEPYALISSGNNCYACHQDIWFHDGTYRGFDTCIVCHATAGSEDRPRYVAAGAPDTPGVTVNFRTLLHKVHMGKKLTNASTFTVIGSGPGDYPDNFTANTFDHILFPPMPGGATQCVKCHGATDTSWELPAPRDHPSEQGMPVLVWRAACVTCHDASSTDAHAAMYTTVAGVESCGDCHAPGGVENVELVHKPR